MRTMLLNSEEDYDAIDSMLETLSKLELFDQDHTMKRGRTQLGMFTGFEYMIGMNNNGEYK